MTINRWAISLACALLLGSAQAQTPANCALANVVDSDTYATLTLQHWSEADQDEVNYIWAECRAAKLRAELKAYPKLSARIDTLRKLYRDLRNLEGGFAYVRNGGGTMYSHAIPRSYPWLETRLASLAALARSNLGAQRGPQHAQMLANSAAAHIDYLIKLREFKPAPDETWSTYDPARWLQDIKQYEKTGQQIMDILGKNPDSATVLGYAMLNDWLFDASGE